MRDRRAYDKFQRSLTASASARLIRGLLSRFLATHPGGYAWRRDVRKDRPLNRIDPAIIIPYNLSLMNRTHFSARRRSFVWLFVCVLSVCGVAGRIQAQNQDLADDGLAPEVHLEIKYIQALRARRLIYFADRVLARLNAEHPEAEAALDRLVIEGRLIQGDFEAVIEIIARIADQNSTKAWALKMALADGYFAYGRYAEAEGIYQSLFKRYPKGPPKALTGFFLSSAYKYVQMMLYTQQHAKALKGYRQLSKLKLPQHVDRQVKGEMAELLIQLGEATTKKVDRKKYFDEAVKLAEKLMWVQDVWFGKAIVMVAHVHMVDGDIEAAQKLIDQYEQILLQIDQSLQQGAAEGEDLTSLSPMAECRYLLGVMMHDEALEELEKATPDKEKVIALLAGQKQANGKRATGALQHFVNVFVRYPATAWAPDAGERADQIENLLRERFGARVTKKVTEVQVANVRRIQFQQAQISYNQQQYDAAIEKLLAALNRYPEADEAIGSIGNLARSYIEKQDLLYADMTARQLAEAYAQRESLSGAAGDELLRLAEFCGERELEDKRRQIYDLYFKNYPAHPLAPSMLMMTGERFFGDEDFAKALSYYKQVAENYTNTPSYFDALNKMAHAYQRQGMLTNELEVLNVYIARLGARERPGQALMQARFRQAQAYKNLALPEIRSGDAARELTGNRYMGSTYTAYKQLATLLADPDNPYQDNSDDREKNLRLREASLFGQAYSLSQMTLPTNKVETFKLEAIKGYEEMVKEFPKSDIAPQALSQVGTIWTVLGDPDKAQAALARLREEYPQSREAKNAAYVLAINLLGLGLRQEAVVVFKEMFASEEYSAGQFLRAGDELLVSREYDLALQAFDRALAKSDAPGIRAPALLGKAEVLVADKRYEEAIAVLDPFVEAFGKTIRVVDANLLLSKAASELAIKEADRKKRNALFNRAGKAIKGIRPYRKTKGERAELAVMAGRILARKTEAEKQFGTPEQVDEALGSAIANYVILVETADLGDPEVLPFLEIAYHECIPLMIERENWADAIEYASASLKEFERSKFAVDIRNWLNEATIKQRASAAAAAPAPVATP